MKYVLFGLGIILASCVSPGHDQSFDQFLVSFGADDEFQRSRIVFPLDYTYYGRSEDMITLKPVQEKLTSMDWIHHEFAPDSIAGHLPENPYQWNVSKLTNDDAEVFKGGLDTGMSITFYFKKIDGKWFLVKVVNKST